MQKAVAAPMFDQRRWFVGRRVRRVVLAQQTPDTQRAGGVDQPGFAASIGERRIDEIVRQID